MTEIIDAPGSDAAYRAGCTCPRMDNGWGRGILDGEGKRVWWITEGCPLHAPLHEPSRGAEREEGSLTPADDPGAGDLDL